MIPPFCYYYRPAISKNHNRISYRPSIERAKNGGGKREEIFCPRVVREAPPSCSSEQSRAENCLFLLGKKRGAKKKKSKRLFCGGAVPLGGTAAGRSDWIFSEIFGKVSSSGVV